MTMILLCKVVQRGDESKCVINERYKKKKMIIEKEEKVRLPNNGEFRCQDRSVVYLIRDTREMANRGMD